MQGFYAFTSSLWQELTKLISTWISLMAFNSYLLITSFKMNFWFSTSQPIPSLQPVFHHSTSQWIFPSRLPISVNLAPNLGGNHRSLSSSSTPTSWGLPICTIWLTNISQIDSSPSLVYLPALTVRLLLPWPLHHPFRHTVIRFPDAFPLYFPKSLPQSSSPGAYHRPLSSLLALL